MFDPDGTLLPLHSDEFANTCFGLPENKTGASTENMTLMGMDDILNYLAELPALK